MNEREREKLAEMLSKLADVQVAIMKESPERAAMVADHAIKMLGLSACLIAADMTAEGDPEEARDFKAHMLRSVDRCFHECYDKMMELSNMDSAFDGNHKLREELFAMLRAQENGNG